MGRGFPVSQESCPRPVASLDSGVLGEDLDPQFGGPSFLPNNMTRHFKFPTYPIKMNVINRCYHTYLLFQTFQNDLKLTAGWGGEILSQMAL